ncbi:MAG: exosortase/archaeosortase family protein [Sedimentisphaerales bacterium]|nr:exosortase/archaeosortase family protein [Sedimentisphaerales bacterium]
MIKNCIQPKDSSQISSPDKSQSSHLVWWFIFFAIAAVTAWAYWPILIDLFKEWQRDDDYSAGQLVPITALFLVWRERKKISECTFSPYWPGVILLFVSQAARTYGLLFMFESAERYSLVLMTAGLVLTVAGKDVFKKVFWILLFLFLMVPLPGQIHNLISGPLQTLATTGSVFLLEAFGANISREGNVVTLNQHTTMAVEEACSGLRMLTAFVIVAAFIAYIIKRSRTQKIIIVLSSIPVGVICNIVRLCITAVLFVLVSTEVGEKFFHDFAGIVMMPIAVLLIFGELWIMKILSIPESTS